MISLNDITAMDIIRRRDGKVCWVLYNEYNNKLQTFLPDMWGQQTIEDYDDKFRYKGELCSRLSRREREQYRKYDIVAVSKSRSPWSSIYNMRSYELSLKSDDPEIRAEAWENFKWIELE